MNTLIEFGRKILTGRHEPKEGQLGQDRVLRILRGSLLGSGQMTARSGADNYWIFNNPKKPAYESGAEESKEETVEDGFVLDGDESLGLPPQTHHCYYQGIDEKTVVLPPVCDNPGKGMYFIKDMIQNVISAGHGDYLKGKNLVFPLAMGQVVANVPITHWVTLHYDAETHRARIIDSKKNSLLIKVAAAANVTYPFNLTYDSLIEGLALLDENRPLNYDLKPLYQDVQVDSDGINCGHWAAANVQSLAHGVAIDHLGFSAEDLDGIVSHNMSCESYNIDYLHAPYIPVQLEKKGKDSLISIQVAWFEKAEQILLNKLDGYFTDDYIRDNLFKALVGRGNLFISVNASKPRLITMDDAHHLQVILEILNGNSSSNISLEVGDKDRILTEDIGVAIGKEFRALLQQSERVCYEAIHVHAFASSGADQFHSLMINDGQDVFFTSLCSRRESFLTSIFAALNKLIREHYSKHLKNSPFATTTRFSQEYTLATSSSKSVGASKKSKSEGDLASAVQEPIRLDNEKTIDSPSSDISADLKLKAMYACLAVGVAALALSIVAIFVSAIPLGVMVGGLTVTGVSVGAFLLYGVFAKTDSDKELAIADNHDIPSADPFYR
ncbi:MAG: hypothetical protein P1U74_09155 [Legionellaceae bacterium]|nr:hypothetical protein [Legionellaceae bacterium]